MLSAKRNQCSLEGLDFQGRAVWRWLSSAPVDAERSIEPQADLDRSQSLGFRSLVREPEPRPSKMSPGWTAEPSSDPFRVDQGAAASKARAKTSAGVR